MSSRQEALRRAAWTTQAHDFMASEAEREIFASAILAPVAQMARQLPPVEVTGFLAMRGTRYTGDLMVVGRAVNGWTEGVLPASLATALARSDYAVKVFNKSRDNANETDRSMHWVAGSWGAKGSYNTRRSAFWRVIRRVVERFGIARDSLSDWPSHVVWSNLFKVSPYEGGNPGSALRNAQFNGCVELLRAEFEEYRPSRLLLLTGASWADPFLHALGVATVPLTGLAHRRGMTEFSNGERARVVVAAHPQGKREADWTRDVLAAFMLP